MWAQVMVSGAFKQAANRITVFNNGDGVPVEVHKEEGVYGAGAHLWAPC